MTASKPVLEGTDLQIPTDLKPAELNWKESRPREPWLVRPEALKPRGHWHLEWIEVFRDDVIDALGLAVDSLSDRSSAETSARRQVRPTPEARGMPAEPTPGSTSIVAEQRPGSGAQRRGPRPQKLEQTKTAMRNDLQLGRRNVRELNDMLEKILAATYGGVSRDTARKARKAVLLEFGQELHSRQTPTNDK